MKNIITIFFFFLCCSNALGATYYLSPSGSDGANGTTIGTPKKTFANVFAAMSAGDELILLDGTYSVAAGTGCINFEGTGSGQPKSGTSRNAQTIIRANNAGAVTIDGTGGYSGAAIFIGRSTASHNYIKIQGLKAVGAVQLYNADYCVLKDIGVNGTLNVGSGDHLYSSDYNLIEDCWVWSSGNRIIAINYEGRYNTWRRVVIRGDGCNTASCIGSGNPNVGVSVYNSQYTSFQNVMVVDRILGGGEPYSDFATAQHTGSGNSYPNVGNKWIGCISLNSEDNGYHFESDDADDGTWSVINSISWDSAGLGFNAQDSYNTVSGVLLDHFTTGINTTGIRVRDISGTLRNSISYDASGYGVNVNEVGVTYMDVYGAVSGAYQGSTCSTGCLTLNPRSASLLYLPRIENGAALDGTASDSGDYGATILYKYGTDGTIYGDTGHDSITANALWPWPNESRIKTDMAASSARGFAATGTQLDGTSSITLTSYIWEYLGNQMPTAIYGEPADPTCTDSTQNGDETGVDCGGSCPACSTPATGGTPVGVGATPISIGGSTKVTPLQ